MPDGPVELCKRFLATRLIEAIGSLTCIPIEIIRRKKKREMVIPGIAAFQTSLDIVSIGNVFEAQGVLEGSNQVPVSLALEFYLVIEQGGLQGKKTAQGHYCPDPQGGAFIGRGIGAPQFIISHRSRIRQ